MIYRIQLPYSSGLCFKAYQKDLDQMDEWTTRNIEISKQTINESVEKGDDKSHLPGTILVAFCIETPPDMADMAHTLSLVMDIRNITHACLQIIQW